MKKIYLIMLLLALVLYAHATPPERIIADRPGYSTGTHAVTPGVFYLETGYELTFAKGEKNSSDLPVLNFRTGIISNMEIFIGWDGLSFTHAPLNSELNLPSAGMKYRLYTSDDFNLTAMGTVEFSRNGKLSAAPAAALLWDYELASRWELFGMLQAGYEEKQLDTQVVVGLGFSISEKTDAFLEYYHIMYPGSTSMQGLEFGLLYFLSNNIQLDIYGGIGFHEDLNHYVGLGFSRRF
jgi:hypothetical protein